MTVRNGREFLAIPGPTVVPDEVLRAMHRPAVDIYSDDLFDVTKTCLADLKRVFATEGRMYIYAANGHGAWEAALSNVLSRGEKILVLESGRFAIGWGDMARPFGLEVEVLAQDQRRAVDPGAVLARLAADTDHTIKAVLVVQVDTASGVVNDIPAIRYAIDGAGHPALFMVDTIASLATMPYEMDAWRVDVTVAGSQKGLMTPPGLSFTAAGPKAVAAHEKSDLRTSYWDWTARDGELHYMKFCGTPPEHLLFGLRQGLDLLLEEGLKDVFCRHALLAEAVRCAVEVWAQDGALELNIVEPGERSNAVTTVIMHDREMAQRLLDYCREKCGVVLGVMLGELVDRGFRIAHMGHVNAPTIFGILGSIEMALGALGVPHGKGGTQAAVRWLAGEVRPATPVNQRFPSAG